jgi:broad specificity phosphatase PhoE
MMPADTHIHLVRHGHVHNTEKVFYGRLPRFRLSRKGVRQARETARYFREKPIAAVYSSPMLRARQTARELLGATGLQTMSISRLINEVRSPLEGRPSRDVDALGGRMYTGLAPGFETPQDIVNRSSRFLKRVAERCTGKQALAVTHGDVIFFSLLWALEKPLDASCKGRMDFPGMQRGYPAHGSVTTFRFEREKSAAGRPSVRYWQAGPSNEMCSNYLGASTR